MAATKGMLDRFTATIADKEQRRKFQECIDSIEFTHVNGVSVCSETALEIACEGDMEIEDLQCDFSERCDEIMTSEEARLFKIPEDEKSEADTDDTTDELKNIPHLAVTATIHIGPNKARTLKEYLEANPDLYVRHNAAGEGRTFIRSEVFKILDGIIGNPDISDDFSGYKDFNEDGNSYERSTDLERLEKSVTLPALRSLVSELNAFKKKRSLWWKILSPLLDTLNALKKKFFPESAR